MSDYNSLSWPGNKQRHSLVMVCLYFVLWLTTRKLFSGLSCGLVRLHTNCCSAPACGPRLCKKCVLFHSARPKVVCLLTCTPALLCASKTHSCLIGLQVAPPPQHLTISAPSHLACDITQPTQGRRTGGAVTHGSVQLQGEQLL